MPKLSQDRIASLKEEIKMAEKHNNESLRPIIEESLQRYTNQWLPPNRNYDWTLVLNEVYPVIQNSLPAIFFRNPKAYIKPRQKTFIKKVFNPETQKKEEIEADSSKAAKTQEDILNYIISEIGYKEQTRKVLTDALMFPYGVMWHGYKGDFGMTDEESIFIDKEQIFVNRVAPMRFLYDPCVCVSDIENGRWVARAVDVRLDDLLEDDDLDVDKKTVRGFEGFGNNVKTRFTEGLMPHDVVNQGTQNLLDVTSEKFKKSNNARFVRVYEVFVRPTKKEQKKGSKGNILLLTMEQDRPLRESDWTIKAEGWPVQILEFNYVPESRFGLADYEIYGNIADQKNHIINLQIRNAEQNTKAWIAISKPDSNEEDIEKMRVGDNEIILFNDEENVRNRISVESPNGNASSELYQLDSRIERNLQDKSGVTDLDRGFAQSGEESATSIQARSRGGARRPLYRQDIMKDFLTRSMHYINQLNRQFMTINDAVRVVGSLDLEWSDKPTIEDIQADTDVEIDAISMLPEDPEQEVARYNAILQLAVQAITDPNVANKIAQEGKTINIAPLIQKILQRSRIHDPDIFRNITQEESMGFVSVAEIRAAEANVNAIMQGQELPSPPAPEQDHKARIEVYRAAAIVAASSGNEQLAQVLQQLIQVQAQIMEEEDTEAKPGRPVGS